MIVAVDPLVLLRNLRELHSEIKILHVLLVGVQVGQFAFEKSLDSINHHFERQGDICLAGK